MRSWFGCVCGAQLEGRVTWMGKAVLRPEGLGLHRPSAKQAYASTAVAAMLKHQGVPRVGGRRLGS